MRVDNGKGTASSESVPIRRASIAVAWSLLGFVRRSDGDLDRAMKALLKAVEFESAAPRAMYGISLIHASKGEVDAAGDTNGDGVSDVIAGAPGSDKAYVFSGRDGKVLLTIEGEQKGESFGRKVSDVGDWNGDGHADLIIGAWQHGGGAPSGGKTYLYSGKTGALLKSYTCQVDGETFGFDATGIGDVDGDGSIDFLFTSAWSAVNGYRSGRMFILSGKFD